MTSVVRITIFVPLILLFSACSNRPVVPEAKSVTVQREEADKKCKEIGRVQGSVTSHGGSVEQAIEDMKLDAARKGANYVRMEATSALGSSVSGTAYSCP
jgi:Flp pilus assembly protein TadD